MHTEVKDPKKITSLTSLPYLRSVMCLIKFRDENKPSPPPTSGFRPLFLKIETLGYGDRDVSLEQAG